MHEDIRAIEKMDIGFYVGGYQDPYYSPCGGSASFRLTRNIDSSLHRACRITADSTSWTMGPGRFTLVFRVR